MSLWTSIRDTAESIAPTAIGAMLGGPAGGALAGQLAKPLQSKSSQASDLQKAVDVADVGLGMYGAYQGITGGSPFGWGGAPATAGAAPGVGGAAPTTGPGTAPPGTKPPAGGGAMGTMGRYAMPLAMGLSAVSSMGRKPTDYTPQLQALAAPAMGAADTLLKNYSAGKLLPSDQQQIDTWEKQQIAQVQDYYARSGQGDSTMAQSQIGNIKAQAEGMRSQALQGMLTSGLNAIGVAQGPVMTAIQTQIAQDQQMQQAQSQLFMTLAMFGARS